MKLFKAIVSLILTASIAGVFITCSRAAKTSVLQPVPTGLSVPEKQSREMKNGDVYVSPNGNDNASGSVNAPVKTPQKALELARSLKKTEKVIYFKKGEYNISSITLSSEDNGVTLFGESGVSFNGGVTLESSDFNDYSGKIKVLDLKKYGITGDDIGSVRAFGQYNTADKYGEQGSMYCELFCGNERMTLSRYPNSNEENLKTGKIIDNGDSREIYTKSGTRQNENWEALKNPRGGKFEIEPELSKRIDTWKNSPDIWIFGYFQYDWADSTTPLKTADETTLTTKYASVYGFKENMPYYFFNVFEELDAENEWYIDKENLLLYFIPPNNFHDKKIQLSLETENLITLDNVKDITFDGISFSGTRASAVFGSGCDITIKNCEIKNVGENGIELTGERITAENNVITATGKGGVILTGGNREALASSGNIVTNNLIYDWSQVYQTYQAAVALHGVGATCSHNEIYNSPHEAVTYSGNNHIIEYNVIHDVVLKSSDAGAIYAGRSWSACGNIIRYNCIYNIGSKGFEPNAIYFDDALSGQSAYGNLLINIPGRGFLIGGGRDLNIENNMIINAAIPIEYDDRAIAGIEDNGWFAHALTPNSTLWQSLKEVDINSQIWKESYPQLSQLTDDFDNTASPFFAANPANSTVKNNITVGKGKNVFAKRVKKYSEVTNNPSFKNSDKLFTDESSYKLKAPIEAFKDLPLEEMGRLYTH